MQQFSSVSRQHGLGECSKATPIQAGLFKQNVLLKTENGEWIFRGDSHYTWQFPKERFFAHLIAKETGLPTPVPYLIDTSYKYFDYDFALMPKMPGMQLSDQALFESFSATDQKKIAFTLGHTLRALQTYQAPFYGEFDEAAGAMVSYSQSYSQQLTQKVETLVEASNMTRQTISDSEKHELLNMFRTNEAFEASPPVITLQDYKDGNMCVAKVGDSWQVTGLFDLMEARFGHRLEDLPRQYAVYIDAQRLDLAASFLQGYGLTRDDTNLFNRFLAIDRLIVWEYFARNVEGRGENILSEWMKRYSPVALPSFKEFTGEI